MEADLRIHVCRAPRMSIDLRLIIFRRIRCSGENMLAATQVTQVTEHWSISIAFKSISTSRSSSSFNMTASRNQACHQRQLMLLMLMMISTYCIRSSGFLIRSSRDSSRFRRSRNVQFFGENSLKVANVKNQVVGSD